MSKDYSKFSDAQLLALKKQTELDISKYHNFQLVRKIQLNSAYGAIGNQYFRYYSTELAEAITLSGQLSIQWIGQELNKYLNKVVKTEDIDYVIASDTDSVYLRLDKLVDKVFPSVSMFDGETKVSKPAPGTIVDFLDKSAEELILPFIEKKFQQLADTMNAYENKMQMGREVIADKGIWTAKKRYMLNVWDSEGVRYNEPKLKIMGIETTRSSTPEFVRKHLKTAINITMNGTEQDMINFVEKCRKEFYALPAEDIAFPRSVNGMDKYADRGTIYKKSTPIAVKGALIYNHYLNQFKISKKYKRIIEGDKIKFLMLKKPNPLGGKVGEDQVISFPNVLPKEFKLERYIDYKIQFEKSFIDPLTTILDTIGWSPEKRNTLENLFG
jgi:DNA polymerase elongation subunit (family B)